MFLNTHIKRSMKNLTDLQSFDKKMRLKEKVIVPLQLQQGSQEIIRNYCKTHGINGFESGQIESAGTDETRQCMFTLWHGY